MALCSGHKTNGDPCPNHAMRGQKVCHAHGGRAPQNKAAAERRLQEAAARREVLRLGLASQDEIGRLDPRDHLAKELWRTSLNIAVLETLVGDLDLDEGGIYSRVYDIDGAVVGGARPHVLWQMLNEERDRGLRAAGLAAKVGVEERRLEMDQDRAVLIADVFRRVFNDPELGLTPKKREEAMIAAARHLRALPAA